MSTSDNLKRGTVELLLLTLLREQDMYGYQLSQELAGRSEGLFEQVDFLLHFGQNAFQAVA